MRHLLEKENNNNYKKWTRKEVHFLFLIEKEGNFVKVFKFTNKNIGTKISSWKMHILLCPLNPVGAAEQPSAMLLSNSKNLIHKQFL